MLFIGDFIFKGSIGRCDLPGGSEDDMRESILKIMNYDDDITLYPGHYEITNLGEEKKNNPYLKWLFFFFIFNFFYVIIVC